MMTDVKGDASYPPPPPPPEPPGLPPPPPPPPPPSLNLPEQPYHYQQGMDGGWAQRMDGGWAWVVLLASFMVSIVVDGVGFSVGVLLSSLQKEFAANNQQVSWMSSVLNGTYLLIGPAVSFFVNRYGCRKNAILGCLIAAVSFALSILCTSIQLLIFVYGLAGGIGLGFLYLPSIVIVGHYFHARRALALGITACGSGIGAFALAPVFSVFVERHGWRGATFLASGLVLFCVLACTTFKPVNRLQSSRKLCVISAKSSLLIIHPLSSPDSDGRTSKVQTPPSEGTAVGAEQKCLDETPLQADSILPGGIMYGGEEGGMKGDGREAGTKTAAGERDMMEEKLASPENHRDEILNTEDNITKFYGASTTTEQEGMITSGVHPERIKAIGSEKAKNTGVCEERVNARTAKSISFDWSPHSERNAPGLEVRSTLHLNTNSSNFFKNKRQRKSPLKGQNEFQNGFPVVLNQSAVSGSHGTLGHDVPAASSKKRRCDSERWIRDTSELTVTTTTRAKSTGLAQLYHWVCLPLKANVSLMKRPSAVLYGTACFLMSVGMYVPATFLPPVAEHLDLGASLGAFLVSALGIGNVVGRLLTGLIAHYQPRLVLALNCACLILAGLLTCLLPLLTEYYLMVTYSLLFGACIGMFVVLQLMVLIELLGLEHLTSTFGVVNMYQGIGTFVGPPLAGLVADCTGELNNAFYTVGVAFALAGLISLPLHRTAITECRQARGSPGFLDLSSDYNLVQGRVKGIED